MEDIKEMFLQRPIKIVLADDHEVVRAGLKRLLTYDKTIEIVDEAKNGVEAVELVRYHKPDVALLDILMPRKNGIDATKDIKAESNEVLVVMLTAFEDSQHLESALAAGADGYLSKDIGAKDLIEALHNVMMGERVFSKSIIKLMQRKYTPYNPEDSSPVSITKREQEILNKVADGMTSKEISERLDISVRTVQAHRSNVMQKLGLKTGAELIRYAVLNYEKSSGDVK